MVILDFCQFSIQRKALLQRKSVLQLLSIEEVNKYCTMSAACPLILC